MGLGLPEGPLVGLLGILLATLMLGVVIGGVLYQHEIAAAVRRLGRWLSPPPEPAARPPIEEIARDVRRLRGELLALAPGTPQARRIGVSRAYDDALLDACQALGVPGTFTELPPGTARAAERLLVEHELDAAGLRLRS